MQLDDNFRDLLYNPNHNPQAVRIFGAEAIENQFILHRKDLPDLPPVVSPSSGSRYWGSPTIIAGSDHFSIAKPKGMNDRIHEWFYAFYRDIPRDIRTNPVYSEDGPNVWKSGSVLCLSDIEPLSGWVERARLRQPFKNRGQGYRECDNWGITTLASPGVPSHIEFRIPPGARRFRAVLSYYFPDADCSSRGNVLSRVLLDNAEAAAQPQNGSQQFQINVPIPKGKDFLTLESTVTAGDGQCADSTWYEAQFFRDMPN
jgi:hypothetical protein